jgi:multidrug efflux pump subunit AcrA (membrane-fusion protein)
MNPRTILATCLLIASFPAWSTASGASGSPAGLIRLDVQQQQLAGIRVHPVGTAQAAESPAGEGSSGLRLSGQAVVPDSGMEVVLASADGQVQAVLVTPGQSVSAGQPLARLYSPGAVGLQRAWLQARSRAEVAASTARRAEDLHAAGIIAESRLQQARADLAEAEASRAEQRQLLRIAGMGDAAIDGLRSAEGISPVLTIVARANGTVLEQLQGAGQAVAAGTALLRVASGRDLWIELRAARAQSAELKVGDAVNVPGCPARARLVAVGGGLDAGSQTVGVRALLPGGRSCLQPGQYLEATVLARPAAGLVSVPQSALVSAGGVDYVFVREAAGFRPLAVHVVQKRGQLAWLAQGPPAGAQVASAGLTSLKGAWQGFGSLLAAPATAATLSPATASARN